MADICEAEFIDGQWTGCGCHECTARVTEEIERDYECGAASYEETLYRHHHLGAL